MFLLSAKGRGGGPVGKRRALLTKFWYTVTETKPWLVKSIFLRGGRAWAELPMGLFFWTLGCASAPRNVCQTQQ